MNQRLGLAILNVVISVVFAATATSRDSNWSAPTVWFLRRAPSSSEDVTTVHNVPGDVNNAP